MDLQRTFGRSGNPTRSRVNAFELRWSRNSEIEHYDVVLTPTWSNRSGKPIKIGIEKGIEIMRRLQTKVAPDQFSRLGAFDGKKNLFSFVNYNITEQEYRVPWDSAPSRAHRARATKEVLVRITHVRTVNVNLLRRLKEGQDTIESLAADSESSSALTMLNLFVQAQPRISGNLHKGKSVYVPSGGGSPIGSDISPLKLWPGFFQSVRPTFGKIIVNIDATVGVVMPEQPLEDAFMSHLRTKNQRDLRRVSENTLRGLRQFFKGVKVRITLPSHRERSARPIKDMNADVGAIEFECDGQETTVGNHFHRTHNVRILDGTLGVKIGSHEWFPITVCHIVQQLYKSRLSPDQVREVLAFTAPNPQSRIRRITAGWQHLGHNASEFLRGAGIEIDQRPLTVNARVLQPLQIGYGKNEVVKLSNEKPGSWDVIKKELVSPAKISCMLVANFTGGRATDVMYQFVGDLIDTMSERGMRVMNQTDIQNISGQAEVETILLGLVDNNRADFILAILPENAGELYTRVKRFGDILKGVATQCVRWSRKKIWGNYSKRGMNQYHNNLILKVNAKLGGLNHVPLSDGMTFLGETPTMVIGADVSHPGPGSTNPSIASVVASWDKWACKYCAIIKLQHSRLEIIKDIREMIRSTMNMFREKGGPPPKRIFFFRDGVSEGEFETVRQHELKEMQEEIEIIYKGAGLNFRPKFTFIIVGKRHHFRFFPDDELDKRLADGKTGNCPSGFVVDKDIAHPVYRDFYLQSQPGLKGTSIPGHYTVLHDDNLGYNPDHLQQLTYSLCHCYSRATKAVKIPAPVYYADLVCRRAKFHYHPDVQYSDDMSVVSGESSHFDFFTNNFAPVQFSMLGSMYFV